MPPIQEVCSPVNKMKRSAPTTNAPSLKTVNLKTAHPQERGPSAPMGSAKIAMPGVPGFEQPDAYHPSGGRNR
jgi:hypothetical protein